MASSKEYLDYVLELLSKLDKITYRPMMGEYIIYYCGKVVGGVYDDRFLVKPTDSAKRLMPDATYEIPYEGGRQMILVDSEDRDFLAELIDSMYSELPEPKKKPRI